MEDLVSQSVDHLNTELKKLVPNVTTSEYLNKLIPSDVFSEQLISLKWSAIDDSDKDIFVDTVFNRVLTDALSEPEEDDNDTEISDINEKLKFITLLLDLCFHSKSNRHNINTWSASYFNLFTIVINLLNWPEQLLQFWPFTKSRQLCFKILNSDLSNFDPSQSNLNSYKVPLRVSLRKWNEILLTVSNNYHLNTPLDYTLLSNFRNFLSEILPINEESNINKFSSFFKPQRILSPWIDEKDNSNLSDSEIQFHADYDLILNTLLTNPLSFIDEYINNKCSDILDALNNIVSTIMNFENDFYAIIDSHKKNSSKTNRCLNEDYPIQLTNQYIEKTKIPNYINNLSTFSSNITETFDEFNQLLLNDMNKSMLQTTMLDLCITNASKLYSQILDDKNDYFRKQIILQIFLIFSFIINFIKTPEIKTFYSNIFLKNFPDKTIKSLFVEPKAKFNDLLKFSETIIIEKFINFFEINDPHFNSILIDLSKSDLNFVKLKIDSFKKFQKISIPQDTLQSTQLTYKFPVFGAIKLGNKNINKVWKEDFKFDENKTSHILNPDTLFNSLQSNWEEKKENSTPMNNNNDDQIVKQWQTMRSLRSKYLFKFNNVDEKTGIDGIFDPYLKKSSIEEKKTKFQSLKESLLKPHLKKLQDARDFENEKRQKRERSEQLSVESEHKRQKLEQEKTHNPEETIASEKEISPTPQEQ